MKILIHIPQLIFGGAEKVLVSFTNDLVNRGHRVEILESYERGFLKKQFDNRVTFNAICSEEYTEKYYASSNDIKREKNIFKKIFKCGKKLFSLIVGYRAFAEKLCAKHYKHTHFDVAINYLETEPPSFILKHIKAKKHIQWFHADITGISYAAEIDSYIPLYEKTDAIICVSQSAKDHFTDRYPSLRTKTHLIYNFFDAEYIKASAVPAYNFDTKKPIILSAGRMTEQKAYLRFLKILSRLRDENIDFSYHILGDGVLRPDIEKLISDLDLCDRVTLHGLTNNPYKYMSGCDLFALPSIWEAFPTVTVEAKILNVPVLATNVSGISEQIVHGKTGYIVNNDEESIYSGLKALLSDPQLLHSLTADNGMENICDNEYKYDQFISVCNLER